MVTLQPGIHQLVPSGPASHLLLWPPQLYQTTFNVHVYVLRTATDLDTQKVETVKFYAHLFYSHKILKVNNQLSF